MATKRPAPATREPRPNDLDEEESEDLDDLTRLLDLAMLEQQQQDAEEDDGEIDEEEEEAEEEEEKEQQGDEVLATGAVTNSLPPPPGGVAGCSSSSPAAVARPSPATARPPKPASRPAPANGSGGASATTAIPMGPPPIGITGSMDQDTLRARHETSRVLQLLQNAVDTSLLARAHEGDLKRVRDALEAFQARLVQLQRQHEEDRRLMLVHVYEQQRLNPVAEENGAALFSCVYRR